jgi:prephenate dehydratase
MKNINKIYYQGSKGSYSESVLKSYFPNKQYVECQTFREVVAQAGGDDYGLLPVENSLVGTVVDSYENLIQSELTVYGEFKKKITHALIGLKDSKLENIERVISHPQALQQCSNFLQEMNVQLQPVFDTAGSVLSLLDEESETIAGIAGEHFEGDSRFKVLKKNISNHVENYTRFFLVGDQDTKLEILKNKRSAILIADDKPGSLLSALKIFEETNVNLTKLESRPIIGSPWEYKFYIDYQNSDGYIDTQLKDKLDLVTKKFKIIGRYGTIDL